MPYGIRTVKALAHRRQKEASEVPVRTIACVITIGWPAEVVCHVL